jgi:hypothetical protein
MNCWRRNLHQDGPWTGNPSVVGSVVGPVEMMRSTIATICPGGPPRLAPELMNDQAGLPNPRSLLTKSGSTEVLTSTCIDDLDHSCWTPDPVQDLYSTCPYICIARTVGIPGTGLPPSRFSTVS